MTSIAIRRLYFNELVKDVILNLVFDNGDG
jgi:hypothetical protein